MTEAGNQSPLTERQMEVLQLVAQGATNRQIGRDLDISEHTVRKHLQNIFEKLEVGSRTEATTLAYQHGWFTLPAPGSTVEVEATSPAPPRVEAGTNAGARSIGERFDRRLLAAAAVGAVAVVAVLTWVLIAAQATPAPTAAVIPRDSDLDRWVEAAPLATPRTSLAAVRFEGRLYAIGGETPAGPTWLTAQFDPVSDKWTQLADKPTPVRDVGAAVLGASIYVPGGCLGDGSPSDVLEVYDPEADTWGAAGALPQPLCAYAIAAFEGNLYVFGGWDGREYTDAAYLYDPDEDKWQTVSPMPAARGYSGAAVIEGQIYVVGGYDGERELGIVEAYTPSDEGGGEQPWVEHAPLPDGRAGAGVVTLQSKLYIIGGGWEAGRDAALQYDVRTDSWHPFASPTKERWRNMGVVVLDTRSETRIYAVGGLQGDDVVATNRAYTALYNFLLPLQQQ
jgi:DNA-binding CsgD family transcriptional regulator/N-acetylneuraminic acid mutarotase